ncbi:unnamed protein product, partial [Adineta ricciae]
ECDLCIGIYTHGRYRNELQTLIGLFEKIIPCRCQINPHQSFNEFIQQIRLIMTNSLKYSYFPFQRLFDQILNPTFLQTRFYFWSNLIENRFDQISSDENHLLSPIFNTNEIILQNTIGQCDFSLTILYNSINEEYSCQINACQTLFGIFTINKLLQRFQILLEQIFQTSDHLPKSIFQFSLILPDEMTLFTQSLLNTQIKLPSVHCIQHEFAQRSNEQSQKVAVELDEQYLTYDELLYYSQYLALYLYQKYEIKPGEILCQCVQRSLSLVIGILSIEILGAIYCPLSPRNPKQRLQTLIEETNTRLILVHSLTQEMFTNDYPTVVIDKILYNEEQFFDNDYNSLSTNVIPSTNIAYIVFTSGSTGKPKAGQLSHRNVIGNIHSISHIDVKNKNDQIIQMANCSFDAHFLEIVGTLILGATLILLRPKGNLDIDYLLRIIKEKQVTVIFAVPSLLNNIFNFSSENNDTFSIKTLRSLCSVGEALTSNLAMKFLHVLNNNQNCRLWNLYGPSEISFCCTYYHVDCTIIHKNHIPIGRSLPDYQCYIVDKYLQPVFVDQEGELLVKGIGVFSGYLHRNDLTQKALLDIEGENVYRTGDLVRLDHLGLLHYVGRLDHQIKLRGQRIELNEIENFLLQSLSQISACIVICYENSHLIAYIQSLDINENQLRDHCRSHLPANMVPSMFIILKQFPLNTVGKVDRNQLPKPNFSTLTSTTNEIDYDKPRNDMEKRVHQLWCEVLQRHDENISINTVFFNIGGHSLLLIQLYHRYRLLFEFDSERLPIASFLQYATITEHAKLLETTKSNDIQSLTQQTFSINEDPLVHPMSVAQAEIFFDHKKLPLDCKHHLILKYVLSVDQSLLFDETKFRKSLKSLMLKHVLLRSTFHQNDMNLIHREHIFELDSKLDLSIIWLTVSDENEWSNEFRQILHKPFKLERDLPLRVYLIANIETDCFTILLVVHRIAADYHSLMKLIHTQLWQLYEKGDDMSENLVTSHMSFTEYVQKRSLKMTNESEQTTNDINWWKEHYASVNSVPLQLPPPEVPLYDSQNMSSMNIIDEQQNINFIQCKTLFIPTDLWKTMDELCISTNSTFFNISFSILWLVLSQYAQGNTFSINMIFTERSSTSTHTIGPFSHEFPLYLSTNESTTNAKKETFYQFLSRTSRLLTEAKQHETVKLCEIYDQIPQTQSISTQPISVAISDISTLESISYIKSSECILSTTSSLTVYVNKTQYTLDWCFDTNLIGHQLIEQLHEKFLRHLRNLVDDPYLPLRTCKTLSEDEFDQVINRFQRTTSEKYYEMTLHGIFERAVQQWPNHIAIEHHQSSITYIELDEHANKIAAYLQHENVKSNDLICILGNKSITIIACILGILKSAAAYTYIDSNLSFDQIKHILDNSDSHLMFIDTDADERWTNQLSTKQLRLKTIVLTENFHESLWTNEDINNEYQHIYDSDSLAYSLWTTGTTGLPKWVNVNHGSSANAILCLQDEIELMSEDKMLQTSMLSFDRSVAQLFHPFSQGACVVLNDNNSTSNDSRCIIQLVNEHDVSVLELSPSLLNRIDPNDIVPPVRLLCISGEICPHHIADLWSRHVSTYNLYGSTETSIYSHIVRMFPNQKRVIIGRPIPNTFSYILNDQMQPVPVGVVGTLWIGGCAPARGYRLPHHLTEYKFLPNPFHQHNNGIIYNTEDLARWQSDGQIEFLGRRYLESIHHNHYIELAEIKRCIFNLRNMGDIRNSPQEVEIILNNDSNGSINDKRFHFYAFVTPASIDLDVVKQHVKMSLPRFMRPTSFMALEQLPLSSSGKIDRKELLNHISKSNLKSTNKHQTYKKAITNSLQKLWLFFLRKDSIDYDETFFDAGGHSALFLQLIGAIQNEFFAGRLSNFRPRTEICLLATTIHAQAILVEQYLKKAHAVQGYQKVFNNKRKLSGYTRALRNQRSAITRMRRESSFTIARRKSSVHFRRIAIARSQSLPRDYDEKDCAVIGMAGVFPGCNSIDEFWSMLKEGRSGISTLSDEELCKYVPTEQLTNPNYVRRQGRLTCGVDLFDNVFFNITPHDASHMDPQHRLLLEVVYKACEDAAVNIHSSDAIIGCFIAASESSYYSFNLKHVYDANVTQPSAQRQIRLNNLLGAMATKVAYSFDFIGAAINVQTACSSGLVALQLAMDHLRLGRCTVAVVGTSCIHLPTSGHLYEPNSIYSPTGVCAPFDAAANGIVSGDAVCAIVLKLAGPAVAQRHKIRAFVKSCAVNNNGSASQTTSFATPSAPAQSACISAALTEANIDVADIAYVEAHGTGTAVGDPIEVEGLVQAFNTDQTQYCTLGSVKSNVGHTDTAAGLVGLIKTVLVLENQYIPPTLHFQEPNSNIDFTTTPFVVRSTGTSFESERLKRGPLLAGVTSLGMGGTNAHAVLQEYRQTSSSVNSFAPQEDTVHQITLSDKSLQSLKLDLKELISWLEKQSISQNPPTVANICYTLNKGRPAYAYRLAMTIDSSSLTTLIDKLSQVSIDRLPRIQNIVRFVFMLPGQHACSRILTRQLYLTSDVFKTVYDNCANILQEHESDTPKMIDILLSDDDESADKEWQNWMGLTTFIVEYGLAIFLGTIIKMPHTFIGHSIGEYVVAVMTGVFTLDEALKFVCMRNCLLNEQVTLGVKGALLAVRISYEDAVKYVNEDNISIAAVNGPSQCVFAGDVEAINQLKSTLSALNYKFKQLEHSFPFHSHLIGPSLQNEFRQIYKNLDIEPRSPKTPFVSSVTGEWCNEGDVIDIEYWCHHMRETVSWHKALRTLDRLHSSSNDSDEKTIYLECALTNVLTNVTKTNLNTNSSLILPLIPQDTTNIQLAIKTMLSTCWSYGLTCNDYDATYAAFNSSSRVYQNASFISMPGHIFNKQHYWIDPPTSNLTVTRINSEQRIVDYNNNEHLHSNDDSSTFHSSSIVDKLIEIYISVIGGQSLDSSSDFFAIGGDSHSALILINRINQQFKVQLSTKDIIETPILDQLAARIEQSQRNTIKQSSPTIRSIYNHDRIIIMKQGTSLTQSPIFLIAPSGGTCFIYRDLCKHLDPSITVLALNYPEISLLSSHEYRFDTEDRSVVNLASYYINIMRSALPNAASYTILGSSFGGMIGYEISQQLSSLSESNVNVNQLFMIDTPTKNSLRVDFQTMSDEKIKSLIFWAMFGMRYNFSLEQAEDICAKDNEQMKQFCIDKQMLPGNLGNFDSEFTELRRHMHIFEENVRAIPNYSVESMKSRTTNVTFLQVKSPLPTDPLNPHQDWLQAIPDNQFHLFYIDGHHITVNLEPYVQQVAHLVNKTILSTDNYQ